jgi:AcrR family transcriptional regulator
LLKTKRVSQVAAGGAKRRKSKPGLHPLWETEARSGPKMEARAHVLNAAAEAFMQRGFSVTTLDDVAARLGTTKGQIYHYYRSKTDLYFDVVVGAFFTVNDQTAAAANLADASATERLRRMAYAHAMVIMTTYSFQRVALEATHHQLIAQMTPRQDRAMRRILLFRDDYENRVRDLISEGARNGEFEILSIPLATKAALGSLNWLTLWFDPKKSTSVQKREEIANSIADFVISGLLPAPLQFKFPPPRLTKPKRTAAKQKLDQM